MKCKLIAVVSKDGFIARYSGDIPSAWTSKEEQKYFIKDISNCKWSFMGRKTHELSYNKKRKRIIFSSSIKYYKYISENHIFVNPENLSFNKIIDLIKPVSTICVLGGTRVHDYFYKKELIDELIITIEPIFFKSGMPLFSNLNWGNFPDEFIQKGFNYKNKKNIINEKGTKYYYLSK